MTKRKLKVGFDLDGVILYNPARVARSILGALSQNLLHHEKKAFYIPKSPLSKFMWYLLHKSSIAIAPGYKDIVRLIKEGKIEAYIVTGRYGSLRHDFEKWMRKIHAHEHFKQFVYNIDDEQPHIFKRKLIDKLKLDVFVEDNWDIVQLLKNHQSNKTKILWITNVLDRKLPYEHKFNNLRGAVKYIKSLVS